jgi:hypothetical protein
MVTVPAWQREAGSTHAAQLVPGAVAPATLTAGAPSCMQCCDCRQCGSQPKLQVAYYYYYKPVPASGWPWVAL